MRKVTLIFASVLCLAIPCYAAQLTWSSFEDYPIYDPDGILVSSSSGWLLQMYESTTDGGGIASTCDFSAGVAGTGEYLRHSATWPVSGTGTFYIDLNPMSTDLAQGDYLYTVIWNNGTGYASDAKFAIIEGVPGAPATTTLGVIESGYDPTSVGATGVIAADWQAVPEPGTMAMFGLGAFILAIRKKLKK